jgi:hypothetical protein
MWRSLVVLLLLAMPGLAAPTSSGNAKLDEARRLFDDLELEKAARALAAAEATPGNPRATTLRILELQALVFGTLAREAKVRDAFRALLVLDPAYALPKDQPPRIRTSYFEAKEWAANNPLLIEAVTGGCDRGECVPTVRVARDTLRLIKKVRFVVSEGLVPTTKELPVDTSTAQLPLGAWGTWRAELLGKADAVLIEVGPFTVGTRPAAVVSAPGAAATEPAGASAPSPTPNLLTPIGAVAGGLGAVAVGLAVAFGASSGQARSQITGATTDERGRVTSLTQVAASALEARARSQATIANALYVTGGVLLAAGVGLVIAGSTVGSRSVAWLVSPTGVSVWGRF